MSDAPRFGVIAADPPWSYANFTDAAHGAADSAMTTMPYADMAALPVAAWAASECVLAMWATFPKLDEALRLMAAWGFAYVTGVPFVKTIPSTGAISRGVGWWFPGAAEVVLFGRVGDVTPASREKGRNYCGLLSGEGGILDAVLYAPRGNRHSGKPETLQDNLERRLTGPYLELFARRVRPGWSCWGYETGFALTPAGVEPRPLPREPMPLFDREAAP